MALSLHFDHAQVRQAVDRQQVTAAGRELVGEIDGASFSNTWIDPVTNTLMLRPACVQEAWETSNTGIYQKLALSAFTLGTSSKWEERSGQQAAGPWLAIKDTTDNDTAITTTSYDKNRGFVVSWFGYGAGQVYKVMECGWNSAATRSSGVTGRVSVSFFSDGTVYVYKDDSRVGYGKITGEVSSDQQQGQFFRVLLLPFRHRELLVYGFKGSGFSIEFTDISPSDTSPTIVPATKFWVGDFDAAVQIQIAPVQFPTTGYFFTQKLSFPEAPLTGATLETFSNPAWVGSSAGLIAGHPAYFGTQTATPALYEWDGTTAFTPDDTEQNCRIRVSLTTSTAAYSPFIYGVAMAYEGDVATTNATEEHDATTNVQEITLSVPDDASGVQANIELRDPQGLESDVAAVRTQMNRPVRLDIDDKVILDGFGDPGSTEVLPNSAAERLGYIVYDAWSKLERYMFTDLVPLDGLNLADAIEFLVRAAWGSSSAPITFDISTTTFNLAIDPNPNSNDWAVLVEVGDTAAGAVQRIMEQYAPNWMYGFKPTAAGITFYAYSPTDLDAKASAITLYEETPDAVTAGFTDIHNRPMARQLRLETIPPEATEIRSTGYDPRAGRPFQAFKVNSSLEDVTAAPSSRPAGWWGEKRRYGITNPDIKDEAENEDVVELLYDRLAVERPAGEFVSTLLLFPDDTTGEGEEETYVWDDHGYPLWRGDKVTISGRGIYRILAFGCRFVREIDTNQFWREAVYTVEYVEAEPE